MLIIGILRAKHGRANRTCKVFDVVFPVASGDVRASEGLVALAANEVETCEVVALAQWI